MPSWIQLACPRPLHCGLFSGKYSIM